MEISVEEKDYGAPIGFRVLCKENSCYNTSQTSIELLVKETQKKLNGHTDAFVFWEFPKTKGFIYKNGIKQAELIALPSECQSKLESVLESILKSMLESKKKK